MRAVIVVGARPNFMKAAPVLAALRRSGHETILVHTGQHYDARMSDSFFGDLGLPEPAYHLGVGSGSHARQTASVMIAFELVLLETMPDWVIVLGDVNSTLACALVAVKLKEETGCRIAHVEAGLRSHDWRMPEEVNRVLTDRVSDTLLTPSRDAADNLLAEGIPDERITFVGNVMIDSLFAHLPRARSLDQPRALGLASGEYVVLTIHRPSNVDDPRALSEILDAANRIAAESPVVLPLHPRTRQRVSDFGLQNRLDSLTTVEPLSYLEMLSLTHGAAAVMTDSGGLQEEATALGVPCLTLREQTERPVTITEGTNRLAPWPLTADGIHAALLDSRRAERNETRSSIEGWDGNAALRIVAALEAVEKGAVGPDSSETPIAVRNTA